MNMTTTVTPPGETIEMKVHEYCRKNMSAYWFGYFLPRERCRIWMLFCYCFKAVDNLTDTMSPVRARAEIKRLSCISREALKGQKPVLNSDTERFLYELIAASKSDKTVISRLSTAFSAQARDSTRGKFVSASDLRRIRQGKSIEIMKLWIYLTDPTLPGKAVDEIGGALGLCGQYLDDLLDLEEDFRMKKSVITEEQAKKYGIRTVDDVY